MSGVKQSVRYALAQDPIKLPPATPASPSAESWVIMLNRIPRPPIAYGNRHLG